MIPKTGYQLYLTTKMDAACYTVAARSRFTTTVACIHYGMINKIISDDKYVTKVAYLRYKLTQFSSSYSARLPRRF